MKPHNPTPEAPTGHDVWSVNLGTDDESNTHHFRMPHFTVGYVLLNSAQAIEAGRKLEKAAHEKRANAAREKGLQPPAPAPNYIRMAVELNHYAALVGACWACRQGALEAKPLAGPFDGVAEYGRAIEIELQACRYTIAQITALGKRCEDEVRERMGIVDEAAERADFGEAEPRTTPGSAPPESPAAE